VKYIRALRRLLANTDRINDLLAASQRIREATDNLTDRMIDKTSALLDDVEHHSDKLTESFDKLQESVEGLANGLQCVVEAITNQSTGSNLRLDRINAALRENHLEGRAVPESDDVPIEAALTTVSEFMRNDTVAARIFDGVLDFIRPHHRGSFWGDRLLTLDKSASFRDDPAFRRAIATTNSSTGMNQYASPDGITWRFHTLVWAARTRGTCRGC
jgi:uncharacterized protein YoxC